MAPGLRARPNRGALPVSAAESTAKVLDPAAVPSIALIARGDRPGIDGVTLA